MGVVLRNLQKVVPVRRARLRKDVDTLRHILGIQKFDLGIICVDNKRIQKINNIYRKKNVPTDVLSFSFYEDMRPGKIPCHLPREELNLGDIFLGVEFVMKQCEEDLLDLHETLTVVAAHGICHLLGYRHETEEEWTEMLQKERYILREYNRRTGRLLEPLTKRFSASASEYSMSRTSSLPESSSEQSSSGNELLNSVGRDKNTNDNSTSVSKVTK
ncbi:endoribonuclease YbeY-like [Thalassophryne amazonica]|uniref:endoribonuclease YbeY-like n=1 Tax=Thalassophryne amazonica TaxID=390379 RepID=UPI0014723507|nr:endoribonuclease YbeY-like [Thalassophryne amazonica]